MLGYLVVVPRGLALALYRDNPGLMQTPAGERRTAAPAQAQAAATPGPAIAHAH